MLRGTVFFLVQGGAGCWVRGSPGMPGPVPDEVPRSLPKGGVHGAELLLRRGQRPRELLLRRRQRLLHRRTHATAWV